MIFIYVFIGSGSNLDRFDDYIETLGARMFRCSLCGKVSSAKSNLKTHVESKHFPGSFVYTCKFCGETFSTRNTHYLHVSRVHHRNLTS